MKMTIILTLMLSVFMYVGCKSASNPQSPDQSAETAAQSREIKQVSVEETKEAVASSNVQFIDVRTKEEYASGHAPKAALFTLDTLDGDLIRLDKDKPVYVICQTGRRSQKGAEVLQTAGFKEIYNVAGGTTEWINKGLPVEKDDK